MASPSLRISSEHSISHNGSRIAAAAALSISRKNSGIEASDITALALLTLPSLNHATPQQNNTPKAPETPRTIDKIKNKLKRQSVKNNTALSNTVFSHLSPEFSESLKMKAEIVTLRNKSAELRAEAATLDRRAQELEIKANALFEVSQYKAEKIDKIKLLLELSSVKDSLKALKKERAPFQYCDRLDFEEIELRTIQLKILNQLKLDLDNDIAKEKKKKKEKTGLKLLTSRDNNNFYEAIIEKKIKKLEFLKSTYQ